MRLLAGLSLFGLIALSMVSQPAQANTAMTMGDGPECMIPVPFGTVPQPISQSTFGCFVATVPILRLDLTFFAPPAPGGVQCGSTFFAVCNVTETAGITDISFTGPPGIPNGTLFEVLLTGFTPSQTVTATPNVPEPSTGLSVLMATLAIGISSGRRRRARVE